ncbi:MAG: hypothetical protein MUE85_20425 [Microscillaceae bacterium]|jgi:hypothetical protein|nr:hypothetical protein [Microscillaceae bacterium]
MKTLIVSLFLVALAGSAYAQQFKNAGEYLDFMGSRQREILQNYMSYASAVAHNKSARKVENRRKELLASALQAKKEIATMPPYQNDKALRDSTAAYIEKYYHVLNDDYDKIINLEEISEQSYDLMEAYFKAQDLVADKLDQANDGVEQALEAFAARHQVRLIENEDELGKKLAATSKVNQYHRELFLIMFKCSNQEKYLLEAIAKKDILAMEQSKNNLAQYADENLKKLATIKSFNNDASLLNACRQIITFYQSEAKTQMPAILDFYVKEANFQKIKKAFELKKESERTKADVDAFNKAVNEMNVAVNKSNTVGKSLNEKRRAAGDNWNNASRKFLDTHTPKY